MKEECFNCKFYKPDVVSRWEIGDRRTPIPIHRYEFNLIEKGENERDDQVSIGKGNCRRYPKGFSVFSRHQELSDRYGRRHEGVFTQSSESYPAVEDEEWCGEWKAKDD